MTSAEYFKGLRILQLAFTAGIVLFLGVTLYLWYTGLSPFLDESNTDLKNILMMLSIFMSVSGVISGIFLFNFITSKAKIEQTLSKKLVAYRNATILRLAVIEGMALFTITAFILTANIMLAVIGGILAGLMALLKPSKDEIIKVFELNPTETYKLNQSVEQVVNPEDLTSR